MSNENVSKKPTHVVSKNVGEGRYVNYEIIGSAWEQESGSMYVKLPGTQIIEGGFYIHRKKDSAGTPNASQ